MRLYIGEFSRSPMLSRNASGGISYTSASGQRINYICLLFIHKNLEKTTPISLIT